MTWDYVVTIEQYSGKVIGVRLGADFQPLAPERYRQWRVEASSPEAAIQRALELEAQVANAHRRWDPGFGRESE